MREQTEIVSINSERTNEGMQSFGMSASTLKRLKTTHKHVCEPSLHTSLTLSWQHIWLFRKKKQTKQEGAEEIIFNNPAGILNSIDNF